MKKKRKSVVHLEPENGDRVQQLGQQEISGTNKTILDIQVAEAKCNMMKKHSKMSNPSQIIFMMQISAKKLLMP